MIDLLDAFEQAWQKYREWLEHPERCQADAPPRPDICAHLAVCPVAERAATCRELVFIDLEYTVKLRPRWAPLVLPAFLARWVPTPADLWCLAPYYFAEFRDDCDLDLLALRGFEQWEYAYALGGDPQRTVAQYLPRSLPGLDFSLPALADLDPYPPWDEGPKDTQELWSWLRDTLYLDERDWVWACARTHQGAYPRALLRTLQQRKAFWAKGLAARVFALSAFQVDLLLEGASARLWCGPFLLLDSIGHGGMGTVWVARDPGLNRAVAIKRIHADRVSPNFEQRFRQEVRRLARLKHPHIAAVHFAPARGELFMAMELVGKPGAPLGQDEDRQPVSVSLDQAIVWLVQILQGLAYAHAQGIIHRDLKPQNLIVDENNNVVIVDFGLAAALQATAERERDAAILLGGWRRVYAAAWPQLWPLLPCAPPSSPVGEPRPDELAAGLQSFEGSEPYPPREQWVSPTVLGPSVDIYPLGHIVVEVLSGKRLFGESPKSLPQEVADRMVSVPPGDRDLERRACLQAQHVFMKPLMPKELQEVTMPQGFVTLIKAMLAKHPELRPAADQLSQVLQPYLRRGGPLIVALFVWGLLAALGAGALTVLWMRAIGGTATDEPHGLDAAVWAILSTAPVLAVAAWVRCRYELQSLRQQLPACLYMLVGISVGATWFYSVQVGNALGLRQWFTLYAPLGFVGRETCLAVLWAGLSSLPGFALLRVLLRIPEGRAWTVAVTTSLGVLGVFFLLPWWGASFLGGLAALVWLWRGVCGIRECARWSLAQWCGPFLPVLAVVGIVVTFVLLLGDQPKADWVRGVLAGVALRLGLFWGSLLLARRVPWGRLEGIRKRSLDQGGSAGDGHRQPTAAGRGGEASSR